MSVKLLTEHHLDYLSLKRCCTASSESKLFKMPHCWKSHTMNHPDLTVSNFMKIPLVFKGLSLFQLALYVLSFLGPKDLLQAAQTCRYWRVLTEDNLLWREKCKEESIDESLVFGTNRLRRRQPSPKSPWKSLYMRQHQIEQNWRSGPIRTPKVRK